MLSAIDVTPESGHESPIDLTALQDVQLRKSYSQVSVKAFIRISEKWGLTIGERCAILGGLPKQTYYKWAKGSMGTLSRDQLERIGVTLGIFKALKLLFRDEEGRMRWFKAANQDYAFKGLSPVQRLTQGGMLDLYALRQYLDALRGGL